MIANAIAAANKRNAEKAKAAAKAAGKEYVEKEVSSTKIELTPEAKIESDNFKANKGKLPWPVEKGAVYIPYGNSKHPEYKALDVRNSGIDIKTDAGSNARAVFAGEVSEIQISQNTGMYTVMISHGDYFTMYSNLSSVSVSKRQKVTIKQSLGKIKTNAAGVTILKFCVSQNTTTMNPSSWLSGK
jgi:murein hydrolase activator